MNITEACVIIVKNDLGEILLLKRTKEDRIYPNIYCLPGGKVNSGENLIDAASRELWEETEIRSYNLTNIDNVNFDWFKVSVFLCEDIINNITISDEHCDFIWTNDFTDEKIGLNTKNIINNYLKK